MQKTKVYNILQNKRENITLQENKVHVILPFHILILKNREYKNTLNFLFAIKSNLSTFLVDNTCRVYTIKCSRVLFSC